MGNDLASGHLDSIFGSQAPMVEQAHAVMFEGEAYVYWRVPGLEARTQQPWGICAGLLGLLPIHSALDR